MMVMVDLLLHGALLNVVRELGGRHSESNMITCGSIAARGCFASVLAVNVASRLCLLRENTLGRHGGVCVVVIH